MRQEFWKEVLRLLVMHPGYVWGGKQPATGLDCSGFVTYPLWMASERRIDWRATHNTDRLWNELPRVQEKDLRIGDLALYFGPNSKGPDDVSHVMVFAGEGLVVGMFSGGPSDTSAQTSRAAGKVSAVKLINYRPDLAGFVRLPID